MKVNKTKEIFGAMTNREVFNGFEVSGFGHIASKVFHSVVNTANKVDIEVAKATLAQFPQMADLAKDLFSDYCDAAKKNLEVADDGLKRCFEICMAHSNAYASLLTREDISEQERASVREEMRDMREKVFLKDTEHIAHDEKVLVSNGEVLAIVAACTAGLMAFVLRGSGNSFVGEKGR